MAEIYVYDAKGTDLDSIGLCGCLMPTSCEFEDVANGLSAITLEHPFDAWGKFRYLQPDRILSVEVPVRNTPEIEDGDFVTNIETWTVLPTAPRSDRTIYNSKNGDKKVKLVKINEQVKVVRNPPYGDRFKVKYKKWSGWMNKDGLEKTSETTIPDDISGIEQEAPSWTIKPQYFRITSVDIDESKGVTVHAQHIFYDLTFNLTRYKTATAYTLQNALDAVLDNTVSEHDFTAQTNIAGTHIGFSAADLDPVTAMLDPSVGLCVDWDAELIRDNFDIYLLSQAGFNRGTTIEYAKNLAGVTMSTDMSNVCTSIRPVGETKDGKPLYLSEDEYPDGCINSELIDQYGFRRTMRLIVSEAKVDGEDIKTADARRMLKDAAEKQFSLYGADLPTVTTSVDFAALGDDDRYKQYKDLDKVYLFDTVSVRHEELGIAIASQVVRILYDCLHEQIKTIELGSLQELTPSISGWQLSGGISGNKLLPGTVGSGQLGDDAIVARHIQSDSIATKHLQAYSITADKIQGNYASFEELVAGNLTATAIHTQMLEAEIGTFNDVVTKNLTAEDIRTKIIGAGKGFFNAVIADNISTAKLTAGQITSGTIDASVIGVTNLDASNIITGTLNGTDVTITNLNASSITSGTIDASVIGVIKLNASNITAGTLDAEKAAIINIDASNISTGTLNANRIAANSLDANKINASTVATSSLNTVVATIANGKLDNVNATMLYADTARTKLMSTAEGYLNTAVINDASITSAKIVSLDGGKIQADTLIANKLVIRGDNGLYYRLNYLASQDTGSSITAEQLATDEFKKHLHGENIVAKSVTADQITAGTITGTEIHANTIDTGHIKAGAITTSLISSDFESSLNLTSNESVNTLITDADDALRTLISTNANGITALTNGAEGLSQRIDANANGLSVAQTWIDENESTVKNVAGYMKFANGTLTIGKSDNAFKMTLTNDKLSFMQAEAEVAYMDTSKLYINSGQIMKDFRIGNYVFVPQENNHMSLIFSRA